MYISDRRVHYGTHSASIANNNNTTTSVATDLIPNYGYVHAIKRESLLLALSE